MYGIPWAPKVTGVPGDDVYTCMHAPRPIFSAQMMFLAQTLEACTAADVPLVPLGRLGCKLADFGRLYSSVRSSCTAWASGLQIRMAAPLVWGITMGLFPVSCFPAGCMEQVGDRNITGAAAAIMVLYFATWTTTRVGAGVLRRKRYAQ